MPDRQPDPTNSKIVSAEELYVDSQRDALEKFRKFAKKSKIKPRTNPGVRKLN